MKKMRYTGLDFLRGCILISMILYHAIWDMVYIFGIECKWFESTYAYIWQQSICWGFILLSGFCWPFGKKHWKRGLLIFGGGAIITIITQIFVPHSIIIFGVLTMLGSCMILTILLDKGLQRWNPIVGFILFFLLFVITRNINQGYLGFEKWNWIKLSSMFYVNDFTTYLGFMRPGFYSTDYFSLFPWMFLFLTGYFLQKSFEKYGLLILLSSIECKWLERIGKHSLEIYMLHQPIIYVVIYILNLVVK